MKTTMLNASVVDYNDDEDPYTEFIRYYNYIYASIIVLGTAFNSFLLAALMTSPETRSRMRNRLISVILINNVIGLAAVAAPKVIEMYLMREHDVYFPCGLRTVQKMLRLTLTLVENWYIVILMVHYTSTLLRIDPRKYFSARKSQIGSIFILAGPWILSIIVGPVVMTHEFHREYGDDAKICHMPEPFEPYAFGTVAPWFLNLGLLIVILSLKNCRQRNQYSSLTTDPSTCIYDVKVKAYVALGIIVCTAQVFFWAPRILRVKISSLHYIAFTWLLLEVRCVMIPFAFLFLEDIRYRVKTWKPRCCSPAPGGTDLTVRYKHAESDRDLEEVEVEADETIQAG